MHHAPSNTHPSPLSVSFLLLACSCISLAKRATTEREMAVVETAMEFLVPSWWEVQITAAAAAFVVAGYWFFAFDGDDQTADDRAFCGGLANGADVTDDKKVMSQLNGNPLANSKYLIKVELLAAKNLIGANMNGTSDPYAIITCGTEKRFSSMVPGSRNPMWGEEFNFSVDELPVEIVVTVHDWDVVWKSAALGSVTISVEHEVQSGAIWYPLDSPSGQVCLQIKLLKVQVNSSRDSNVYAAAKTRRRILDKQGPPVVHQKSGPLQTIFNLLADEALFVTYAWTCDLLDSPIYIVFRKLRYRFNFDQFGNSHASINSILQVVEHSYSCALERSFLYHGRIYVSAWHLCFHSNVFSKQMKVIIPLGDIDEIRRTQHAVINPAITIVLRMGAGGHGVPPLANPDGRVRYKFASFWNRNNAIRTLQRALKNYNAMIEAEKKEKELSALRARSSSGRGSRQIKPEISEASMVKTNKFQPFIKEEVLSELCSDTFPCTVEQYFKVLLDNGSTFTNDYRALRKDANLVMGLWHAADEYDGLVREMTLRSLCNSPMCPPDTAMTEWQHAVLSTDKKTLVFETIQQAHDVPFGSYFEIHCRWSIETKSDCSCTIHIRVGVHFKKWCIMQSKIRDGAIKEYKKGVDIMLDVGRSCIKSKLSSLEIENTESSVAFIQKSE